LSKSQTFELLGRTKGDQNSFGVGLLKRIQLLERGVRDAEAAEDLAKRGWRNRSSRLEARGVAESVLGQRADRVHDKLLETFGGRSVDGRAGYAIVSWVLLHSLPQKRRAKPLQSLLDGSEGAEDEFRADVLGQVFVERALEDGLVLQHLVVVGLLVQGCQDDSHAEGVKLGSTRSADHLQHVGCRVRAASGDSIVLVGASHDDESGGQVDAHGKRRSGGKYFELAIDESRLDRLSVFGGEASMMEGNAGSRQLFEFSVGESQLAAPSRRPWQWTAALLHQSLVLLLELLGRLDGRLARVAEDQGSLAVRVGLDVLQKLVVKRAPKHEGILAVRWVAVDESVCERVID
jgi:hypothetical protein